MGDRYVAPRQLPFGESSVIRKVNLEPLIFLGGGRALLLQVAHPLVAAGVADHSDYRDDPWGRLGRTVDVMMKMSFGPPEVSARQRRRLDATHRRVTGVSAEGGAYAARDPDLLVWVWATLLDTSLLVYERCYGRLPDIERGRYYEEQKLLAHACGVPEGACPATFADFERYVDSMVERELRVTPPAKEVCASVTAPVLRWPVGPIAAAPLRLVTAGLLPAPLREGYGLGWSANEERLLWALFAAAGGVARMVPRGLRTRPSLWLVTSSGLPAPPRFLQVPLPR